MLIFKGWGDIANKKGTLITAEIKHWISTCLTELPQVDTQCKQFSPNVITTRFMQLVDETQENKSPIRVVRVDQLCALFKLLE